ncbi:MAG: RIP metalloprotease [Solirubrobacteraceae bacterium]|nr:RIP metalloprotease [Solirubrobacteraceae bacterium]
MSWLLAFVGFALLVIFHELGHFFAAKAVGMRVERFSLFFPPKIAGIKRGETEYMIGAIPLGGYVKITGMSPDEELPPELRARSYSGSPVWKRIFVIFAGPAVNLVIAFLILWGLFWAQGRVVPGITVAEVQAGSPAATVLEEGDRLTGASLLKNGKEVTIQGDSEKLTDAQAEARVRALVNAIATGACDAKVKQAGDVPKVSECATPGVVTLNYVRDGKPGTTEITPRYDADLQRYRLGLAFNGRHEDVGPATAATTAVSRMWLVTTETVKAIGKLFYDSEARKEVSGVVGSYEVTRQSISVDPVLTLQIIALISLSLAVINLFPFLPLDGGHIFWAVVEKLRGGKRVSTATLERASIVGMMLVLLLFFVGLNNDITRIVDGTGFGVQR